MNQIISIINAFEKFRSNPTELDQYETGGKCLLGSKLSPYIAANAPIEFVMLGFPYKSRNSRDKVVGTMPDLGEQLSIENFIEMDKAIKQVYAPGMRMNIVSDGFIFNDIGIVPDNVVEEYHEATKDFAKKSNINWYNARDFYRKGTSLPEIRNKVVTQFGITPEKLTTDILMNQDTNWLYKGMVRFMEEDFAIDNYPSRNQLHIFAKKIAREFMFRNEAYSNLVSTEFKDYIRLSMHPTINNGKYSIKLIDSPKAFRSPWHCAILVNKEGIYETVHRKDAEAAGYKLVNMGGRPFYFIEN